MESQDNSATTGVFRLSVGEHAVVGRPTREDIIRSLQMLDGNAQEQMVLESGPHRQMRCKGSSRTGFFVEYQDGSPHLSFSHGDKPLGTDTVVYLFTSYIRGDDRWREALEWAEAGKTVGPTVHPPEDKRIVQRHNRAIVINRSFCVLVGSILLFLLGVASFFYMPVDMAGRRGFGLSGVMMAVGFVGMIVSGSIKD